MIILNFFEKIDFDKNELSFEKEYFELKAQQHENSHIPENNYYIC